jgi:hypothetical protein
MYLAKIEVMYITRVPNRNSPPAVLLRESYREGGKVKNRTVANLSSWPEAKVEALARALKGLPPAGLESTFEIARSLRTGTWPQCSAPCAALAWRS